MTDFLKKKAGYLVGITQFIIMINLVFLKKSEGFQQQRLFLKNSDILSIVFFIKKHLKLRQLQKKSDDFGKTMLNPPLHSPQEYLKKITNKKT